MIIKNIKIKGFRNLKNLDLRVSPQKNLIYGRNGVGKTSVLEALFILGFGKSFLKVKKSDIVNYNSDTFSIYTEVKKDDVENKISAGFQDKIFCLSLNEKKLIECLTPNEKMGRYYQVTKLGKEILDKIISSTTWDLPQILIELEKDRLFADFKESFSRNPQISFNDYLTKTKKSEKEIKDINVELEDEEISTPTPTKKSKATMKSTEDTSIYENYTIEVMIEMTEIFNNITYHSICRIFYAFLINLLFN